MYGYIYVSITGADEMVCVDLFYAEFASMYGQSHIDTHSLRMYEYVTVHLLYRNISQSSAAGMQGKTKEQVTASWLSFIFHAFLPSSLLGFIRLLTIYLSLFSMHVF